MATRRTGIHVDGSTIVVVELVGDRIVSHKVIEGGADELGSLSKLWQKGSVRLALSDRTAELFDTNVDDVEDARLYQALIEAVQDELDRAAAEITVAGVFGSVNDAGQRRSAWAATAPEARVEEYYKVLNRRESEIVLTGFCLPADGTFAIIGRSYVEVIARQGGKVIGRRRLKAAGIQNMAGVAPNTTQLTRLRQALQGELEMSPDAQERIERYHVQLARDISQTVQQWQAQGLSLDSAPVLLGPGANTLVQDQLKALDVDSTLGIIETSELGAIMPQDAALVSVAYYAARTAGQGGEFIAFPNKVAARVNKEKQASSAKTRKRVIVGLAALVALVALAVPALQARVDLATAKSDRQIATDQLAQLQGFLVPAQELQDRKNVATQVASQEPLWALVLSYVYNTAPGGANITSLAGRVDANSVTVTIAASTPGEDFSSLAAWMQRLETDVNASNVSTPGFATGDGKISFTLSFTLPLKDVKASRPNLELAP